MISQYLVLLYSNCKALARTRDYDAGALHAFFAGELKALVDDTGSENEPGLFNLLVTKSYAELKPLLDRSAFLSVFYLVNSCDEYSRDKSSFDSLGRLMYEHSPRKILGVEKNLVLDAIKHTVTQSAVLRKAFVIQAHPSCFFLSHDIDSLYGSMLQDGLWAVKKGRIDVMLKLFFNAIAAKPHWFNIDLIMQAESMHDFKSTFYWLVNKGKIDQRQTNSDYDITSAKIKSTLAHVEKAGFENGLHKSISPDSFKEELQKMPVKVKGNRYHYLKYRLPEAYRRIEESGLKLDASLGFAEHYGFRNNYGFPFHPYNMQTQRPHSFLEVPLNIMDGTFQRYMQIPVSKTADTIIGFLDSNRQDALLSVLWHNTFFTDYKYKGYLQEYKKILAYLHEAGFRNMNQSQIIDAFSWKEI